MPGAPDEKSHGKVSATPAALALIADIRADHGPILFHQSGGCCDGSSPMRYPQGDFLIGDNDVLLGEIGGAPFYQRQPVRGTASHRSDHRRRARTRRHVLARQWPREAILTRSTICAVEEAGRGDATNRT